MHSQFSGHYKFIVTNVNGQQYETEWFDNLITDVGLDMLGYQTSNCCWVGNGTTEPSFSDTSLSGSIVASTTSRSSYSDGKQISTLPYYVFGNDTYTFGVSAIIGTVTEVGIGYTSNTTTRPLTLLFSRALIAGGSGITLVSGDQLQVIYQLRLYVPESDYSFTMIVNGIERSCIARPWYVSSFWKLAPNDIFGIPTSSVLTHAYTGSLNANILSGYPTGTSIQGSSSSNAVYVMGSYERGFSTRWLPNKGTFTATVIAIRSDPNYGLIGPAFQISVSPGIEKTNMQTMDINGKFTWSRYS